MTPKTRVAVCGSSLSMAGLAASLQANPDVDIVRIPAITAALAQDPGEQAPTVIAFDLCEAAGDTAVALLRKRPGLLLIGVDPENDRVLVLSGQAEQALSVADLVRVIHQNQLISKEPRGGIP